MLARGTPKNAFFEFFLRRISTHPTPGASCIPRRWRPQPQRTRTDCTSQAAAQAVPEPGRATRADHARQGTHARTLDTLHLSALDTRQAARGRSYRRRALGCLRNVSETVQIWTQRRGSKIYLIFEYICCACNRKPLYSVSKV